MRINTRLTGTSPLLQHNIQLANPDNEWAKRISAVTAKRKKTEDDRAEIGRLEFLGSLYTNSGQVVVPTTNVRKCFQEAAKVTRQGKMITRALNAIDLDVPLIYDGPQTIEGLEADKEFYDVTLVGVGQKRVVRTRPIFRAWACSINWELITEALDYEEFCSIAEKAGIIEGLGDNRQGGYGRFTIEIRAL